MIVISNVNIVVKTTSKYPRVIFLGDFEFNGSSAARLFSIWKKIKYINLNDASLSIIDSRPITKRDNLITHLADDTMIHTNIKLVNAELLQKR